MSYDDVVKEWWKRRFPDAEEPTHHAAITCADATDLLRYFEEKLKAKRRRIKRSLASQSRRRARG